MELNYDKFGTNYDKACKVVIVYQKRAIFALFLVKNL
jgi:hypothetical protein